MRKPAVIVLLAIVLLGTLAIALIGANDRTTLAFTLGVPPGQPVVELRPGHEVCQTPIPVGAAFDAVELQVGTYERAGQPLELTVRRSGPNGDELGSGTLPGGYEDIRRHTVDVGEIPDGGSIALCVENAGRRRVALYGTADAAARTSTAKLDGRPTGVDVELIFRTGERSTLALVPDVLERMSLFRGSWIGAWLYWLLLVGVVIGVPALLAFALSSAIRTARPGDDDERPGDAAEGRR